MGMKRFGACITAATAVFVIFGDAHISRLAAFYGRIANPQPVLTSVSPKTISAGTSNQVVTLNGHNFVSASTVMFNGVQHAAAYLNSSRLTIQLRQNELYEPGTIAIVVVNPPPGGGNSSTAHLVIEGPNRSLSRGRSEP